MKVTELREEDHGIVIILDDKLEVFLSWPELNLDSHQNSLVRMITGKTATDHYLIAIKKARWSIVAGRTSCGESPRSCRF